MTGKRAVVVGASGGIGRALVETLAADGWHVHALSRTPVAIRAGVIPLAADILSETSLATAVEAIAAPVDLAIVATGMLHDGDAGPERALKQLNADRLAQSFAVNAIGPALALKHLAPLLTRERPAAIACLSARVGSISDNRLGGWYGYRAAKAALNQLVRTAAIELARTHPHATCVTLHPGTVDTGLSRPFQAGVPAEKLFTPAFAAERLLAVLAGLTPARTGRCFAWDGTEIAP